jgi:hypothetical protein
MSVPFGGYEQSGMGREESIDEIPRLAPRSRA